MSATSTANGRPIRWDAERGAWLPATDASCPKCGRVPGADGHDPCLGTIPGAISACCGHGAANPYVVFPDVETLRSACSPVVLGSDAARAVGRFDPDGVKGYRAATMPDAPLRATREEAEADERAHRISGWNAEPDYSTHGYDTVRDERMEGLR